MAHKGRRPLYENKEIIDKLIDAVRRGNYVETACKMAGVSESSYYAWLQRAREEKDPPKALTDFLEAIKKAESEAEAEALQIIKDASRDTWQAAAWYLERRSYNRWGRKERVHHEGDQTVKVIHQWPDDD